MVIYLLLRFLENWGIIELGFIFINKMLDIGER